MGEEAVRGVESLVQVGAGGEVSQGFPAGEVVVEVDAVSGGCQAFRVPGRVVGPLGADPGGGGAGGAPPGQVVLVGDGGAVDGFLHDPPAASRRSATTDVGDTASTRRPARSYPNRVVPSMVFCLTRSPTSL